MKNGGMIFLIGFMGAGKTYLGRQLAAKLELPFYDIDLEIEKKANLDVNDIFTKNGEQYFRKIETEVLLNWDKPGVIATGGGIVENEENRKFLKQELHKIIWLHTPWEIIRSRIVNSYRPIAVERTESELFTLWDQRLHLYKECADIVFSGNDLEELYDLI